MSPPGARSGRVQAAKFQSRFVREHPRRSAGRLLRRKTSAPPSHGRARQSPASAGHPSRIHRLAQSYRRRKMVRSAGRRTTATRLVRPGPRLVGLHPAGCMGGSNCGVAAHVVGMSIGVDQPVEGPAAQNCRHLGQFIRCGPARSRYRSAPILCSGQDDLVGIQQVANDNAHAGRQHGIYRSATYYCLAGGGEACTGAGDSGAGSSMSLTPVM